MITRLSVRNFKSIKTLDISCKRVNVLMGEPNVGKSNILESLGLLCGLAHGDIGRYVRFRTVSNLFFDDIVKDPIDISIIRKGEKERTRLQLGLHENGFQGTLVDGNGTDVVLSATDYKKLRELVNVSRLKFIKAYHYRSMDTFPDVNPDYLVPPDGPNLFSVLRSHPKLNALVASMLGRYGLELVLRDQEHSIEVQRRVGNLIVSHPLSSVSDTLRRMVFHWAVVKSNKGATIVLEEPESNSFPFYTQQLAETIGLDRSNQFLISTHNPYFLLSLIEKTPRKDIAVLLTHLEGHTTIVKVASSKLLSEMLNLEHDPFLGLRNII